MKFRQYLSALLLIISLFAAAELLARGGGGGGRGGGGGGGRGGGFHSGGGYGSYYSRPKPWTAGDYAFFSGGMAVLGLFFVFGGMAFWKSKFANNVLYKVTRYDRFWNRASMEQHARQMFVKMQSAWMARDMDRLKELVTPALYDRYSIMLDEMRVKSEINVVKNIHISELRIVSCQDFNDNSKDRYVAHIQGTLLDYTVNENTKRIVKNPRRSRENFTDTYHFVRSGKQWLLEDIDNSVSLRDLMRMRNRIEY